MKRISLRIVLFLLTAVILWQCSDNNSQERGSKIVVTDDLNREISFEKIPDKIISLAPSLTEMIYELGLEEKLAGNTAYCDYPETAKSITKIGALLSIDYEKVLTISPQLALVSAEGNTKEMRDKLKEIGVEVYVSNPRDFKGMKNTCQQLAKIFDVENTAQMKINQWDREIDSVKTVWGGKEKTDALFLVSVNPIMAAGKNTFLNEIMELSGFKNIAAEILGNYPIISREEILKRDPDYIFISKHSGVELNSVLEQYSEWNELKAHRTNKLIFLDANLFSRPGPRIPEAVKKLHSTRK